MHKLNWDDLRFLIVVMERGSLNAAAKELGVNHATVLRRINAFEQENNLELYERHRTGYRVNETYRSWFNALLDVKESVETAQRAMVDKGPEIGGPVRITSTDSLCEKLLPDTIQALRAEHSALNIELISTNSRLDLAQLDAEITVRPSLELAETLTGIHACDLFFNAYVSPTYRFYKEIKSYKQLDWLGLSGPLKNSPAGTWMEQNISKKNEIYSADSFVTLRNMVSAGMGIAILPCCVVTPENKLTIVDAPNLTMKTKVWVANHSDLDRVPRIVACRKYVAKYLSDNRHLFDKTLEASNH